MKINLPLRVLIAKYIHTTSGILSIHSRRLCATEDRRWLLNGLGAGYDVAIFFLLNISCVAGEIH
jgi:hypothetical protein